MHYQCIKEQREATCNFVFLIPHLLNSKGQGPEVQFSHRMSPEHEKGSGFNP
jgi:hypothetical protein